MNKGQAKSIRLSSDEKISLLSNLSTMLAAGVPILESVDSLLDEAKGNPKKLLLILRSDLESGKMIHSTFGRFPRVFDKVTVNLIKASEEAGNLETTLRDVKDNLVEQQEFNDKVRSAMLYPMFVGLVFAGVMGMILVVVVPKIATVFGRLNMELPLPTRAMIWVSNLVMNYGLWLGVGLAALVALVILLFRFQKDKVQAVFFAMPVVSNLVRQIDLTRFARSFYLLISSGLPIAAALDLAEDVIMRKDLRQLVVNSKKQVIAGKTFAEGLKGHPKLVPGMMVKLIEVGERTGSLDRSLKDIAEAMDYQVTKDLKSATALLEPVMLVFVGLAVGLMMLAIIGPIYGMISDVGAM